MTVMDLIFGIEEEGTGMNRFKKIIEYITYWSDIEFIVFLQFKFINASDAGKSGQELQNY